MARMVSVRDKSVIVTLTYKQALALAQYIRGDIRSLPIPISQKILDAEEEAAAGLFRSRLK